MPVNLTRREAAKAFLATVAGVVLPGAASARAAIPPGAAEERIRTEVCVIGGGSGGIGAALAAARAGVNVVLVEREEILGGTATCAYVNVWRPVAGGYGISYDLFKVMLEDPLGVTLPPGGDAEALYARNQIGPRRINGQIVKRGANIGFEPRAMAEAARSLLDATGRCRILMATTFCRARVDDDKVVAVEAWFAGKRLLIEADVFIDCTADGDVCADAGCAYHMGEDPKARYGEPHAPKTARMLLNGMSLCYRITDTGVKQRPYLPKGVKEDSCPLSACFDAMPNGDVVVNPLGMISGNAVVQMEMSELLREARRRVLAHLHTIQRLPSNHAFASASKGRGWGTWTITSIAPRIGVRETRRIVCDYMLNENDCLGGLAKQRHSDIIAIADHHIDIHGAASRPNVSFNDGPFGIPYRCLRPAGVKNLLVASRSAGFSHIAASAARLQRTVITLGQAAGNAAALAAKQRISVAEVDVASLQSRLIAQRVHLTARPEKTDIK